ncbi:hypothetical protein COO60DRAFT_411504 [Scenedesmus sp. NREL 46B-D3]|nr:hypothetical protein COO60DRAFT_411504 [Scenedesmus sp. NREL 46B-D3]
MRLQPYKTAVSINNRTLANSQASYTLRRTPCRPSAAPKRLTRRHPPVGMPRRRRAQPATKARRRRGFGVLIDGLTSELEEQQHLLLELQEEHCKLRSSHDILVGYCDALEFGIKIESARQSGTTLSCNGYSSAAAAAAGMEDATPGQGQQRSPAGSCELAGVNEVEQQLLAQLAQLPYSAQPLGARAEAAAGQQQQQQVHQQQLEDAGVQGEAACSSLSAESNSSSTTMCFSSQADAENRICPRGDKFLLFRWLMAQVRGAGRSF